MDNDPSRGRTA